MSTPARFSDGQYKNWLKCSHSLIIMKEALHDYIDDMVKKLHGDITLKVAGIQRGSSTGNQCGSCSWKNIKLTGGNPRTWSINCKNSICDKWLNEIIAVHDDPHNPTINWKNADISKWPTDCYHVAKVFMPKGQDKTNKMPDDLDAPAILSLMKYCSWFRTDLPNAQILSDLIVIRNTVLHSGDMRVTDSNKDNWIDLMIQLLNDLNIPGDPQAELQMLKREDIDIDFRATEMRVFQRMVNDLEIELTTLKEDMISLQDFQSELSKEMTRLRDNTETATKVNTIEADVKEMGKSLHELRNISDKMVSFFDSNPDILNIKVTETIRNICRDVQDQQKNLLRVETELSAKVSSLEMQMKRIQEETKEQLEAVERRLTAVKEQKENGDLLPLQNLESPRKKRPETDGLKQLKNQTEDKLDTLRRLEYIQTEQTEKAKKLLEKNRAIVIKGHPGEGKTTTALQLIDDEMYRYRRVMLNYPQDWKTVDTDWVDIVILDDIFGQFDLDSGHLQEWMVYLPTIQEHVDAGKIQVIVTTREDILSQVYSKLGALKLFSNDLSLTLSSTLLSDLEKISIFKQHLQKHGKIMTREEELWIPDTGLIGFPHCCSLFAADNKPYDRGAGFSRASEKFFIANITELQNTRFLSLAFLFCSGEIREENLSPETLPETNKLLLMELASYLDISEKQVSITLLRDAYDTFLDLYVVKSISNFSLKTEVKKSCIQFSNVTVRDSVGHVLTERCVEMVVKHCSSEYLYERTYITKSKDNTSQNVFIPEYVYGLLAERMIDDLIKGKLNLYTVETYSALKQINFVMMLKDKLHKGKLIKEFFTKVYDTWIFFFRHDLFGSNCTISEISDNALLNRKCMTFMQLILRRDEDVASLVYGQLLEFLECAHTNNTPDCWQCIEKKNLLQLALCYHQFWIAEKLVTMNACYTHVNLYNAARQGDLGRVKSIIETLKRSQVFSPGCMEASEALWEAFTSGNQRLQQMLIKEGIILDSTHVVDAVNHGDMNVLMKVVENLKCHKKWMPHQEEHQKITCGWKYFDYTSQNDTPYLTALYITLYNEKFDMEDYLLKNEVKIPMCMLASVARDCSAQAVVRVIQNLKDSDNWNPKCTDASQALENAYKWQEDVVSDLMVQERVSLRMENLSNLKLKFGVSLETVEKAIQHMKHTQNWDPKCDHAFNALEQAYTDHEQQYGLCDLLVQEGVTPTMKILPKLTSEYSVSLQAVKKAIQHLKDNENWDTKSDDASKALENAYTSYHKQKYCVCDLLVQEGVSPTMKILPKLTSERSVSLQTVEKAIQHLKDTQNWNPKCVDAFKALENTYSSYNQHNSDVCDLLVEEGVTPTMKILPKLTSNYSVSLQTVKKAIQDLKDTKRWDPQSDDASKALENTYTSYDQHNWDVCDLLVQEGASPTMKIIPKLTSKYSVSLQTIKKAIQHLKDTKKWDPQSDDASEALENAYHKQKYSLCDLLVQEGVSPTMKILPKLTSNYSVSLQTVKKAIQHLKYTDNWDPKCHDASEALKYVSSRKKYSKCHDDLHNLLVQMEISREKMCMIC